ncbi:CHAT domain-containing protein [Agromyces sp. NPDC058484]|uniref:DUF7363 domain-containing protein n=1 Tax=Agromyces sp. NPDC058484 TaxID=3346524 RepID=UPI00365AE494
MKPPPAVLGARGAVRLLAAADALHWPPPSSGRVLARADLVGTGGGPPELVLSLADDVDQPRVVVFVQLGDLLCTFRPSGEDPDALEIVLPFALGPRRAIVVVVECETEAEAEELARIYAAARENLEAAEPEPPREAEPPMESAEPQADVEPPPDAAPPPPVTRSAPPPPPMPSFPVPAPSAPPPPAPSMPLPGDGRGAGPEDELVEKRALAHVLAEMPQRVVVDEEFEVRFAISRRLLEASAGTSHAAQAIVIDPRRDLTVTIALRGFRLVDGQSETVTATLPHGDDDVDEHLFRLVAPLPGRGEVSLVLRQDVDFPLATLRLTAEIVAAGARSVVEPAEVVAPVVEPDSDLVELPSIRIDESIVGTDSTLRIRVSVGGDARTCEVHLDDKAAFISRTYRRVAGLRAELAGIRDRDKRARRGLARLRDIGMGLARTLFEPDVLELLWNAEPDGLDGLIVQTSGELDVPWEVVHLVPPAGVADDGRPRFLSSYGLTRWVYDTAHPTVLNVSPERVRFVCPDYSDRRLRLTHTGEERRFLEHRFAATTIDPDDADGIAGLMHDGFDLLHFAGHGRWSAGSPQTQELLLSAFSEAEDVPRARYSDGELRRDMPDRGRVDDADTGPFVFLNACDIGRLPAGPAALGGFPEAFLRGGAAAFVGCSWAVGDDPASTFVEAFYLALADADATIADAARIARRAARDEADLSELAYAVYAHPRARIHLDPPIPEGPPS